MLPPLDLDVGSHEDVWWDVCPRGRDLVDRKIFVSLVMLSSTGHGEDFGPPLSVFVEALSGGGWWIRTRVSVAEWRMGSQVERRLTGLRAWVYF